MGFTEQLKKARLNMELTQQQVADMMGITKSTYCGYETGKRQPDVTKIKQLACILNTSGDTLLETGLAGVQNEENIFFSVKEKQLVSAYKAHPEMQAAVDQLLGIADNAAPLKIQPRKPENSISYVDGKVMLQPIAARSKDDRPAEAREIDKELLEKKKTAKRLQSMDDI